MLLTRIISLIAYSNLWISIGAVFLTGLFYLLLGLEFDYQYLLFVFSSTLLTYTFQRFMKLVYKENIVGPRMEWMQNNKQIVKLILLISFSGTVYSALHLRWLSLLVLSVMGIISFLYAFKIKTSKNTRTNLRDLPGIKIFLIGLVWAVSCVIIPALEVRLFDTHAILMAMGFLLFIVGITIPFDIRDLDYDEKSKRTIPQVFGVDVAKGIAIGFLLSSLILLSIPGSINYGLIAGISVAIILVLLSSKSRNELFYSFIMDGLLIAVPGSVYLLQSL